MYKKTKIIILILCLTSLKIAAQSYDSAHIYAVSLNSMYRIVLSRDIISSEVAPIRLYNNESIVMLDRVIEDTIKGKFINKLKSNYDKDVRLYIEFFKKSQVIKVIGFTPYNDLFIDLRLYKYTREKLKLLDNYLRGLSKTLAIK